MSRTLRLFDAFFAAVVAWGVCTMIPVEAFWFKPGALLVSDAPVGSVPKVGFDRDIKRNVVMSYSVSVRAVDTLETVCESTSEPFLYRARASLPESVDLEWWAPGCGTLPAGEYFIATTWTATERWWGLLPDRSVTLDSNVFRIEPSAVQGLMRSLIQQAQEARQF